MAENDAIFDSTDLKGLKPDAKNPWKQKKFDEGGHERNNLRFLAALKKLNKNSTDYKERMRQQKEANKEKRHEYLKHYLEKMRQLRKDFVEN